MKISLILICVGICIGMYSGCGIIKNAPAITASGIESFVGYDAVTTIVTNNLNLFDTKDIAQLEFANTKIDNVREQINKLAKEKGSPAELANDLPKLIPLYEQARMAYMVAHNIIMLHIDEFNQMDQITLYSYEATCNRLDTSITVALADSNGNSQTARDIMVFVLMIGKIVVPMLLL